jgi:type IV pilus assembly protein PilE
MHSKKSERGVTLLELVIVVAVIGIIASIAYPSYLDYVREARRVEAYNGLMETAQKLERCFSVFGSYNNVACDVIDNGNANRLSLAWLTPGANAGEFLSQEGNYVIRFNTGIAPTATTFDLQAVPQGEQANDSCGTLTMDEVGQKGQTAGTIAECW